MTENAKKGLKCFLRNGTESKNTSSYILFDHFYAFGLSRNNFFSVANNGEMRGVILDYVPLWTPDNLTGPNWHTSHLDHVSNKIRLQLSLWDTHLENVFGQSPLVGPQGSGLDQNCTCTTRPWGQQNVTINRYLQYLITEEIKEQDIVYVQTDGRPDDERVFHRLHCSSTSRAKNCIHSNSTLILQKRTHFFCIFVSAEQNRLCHVVDRN